VTEKHYFNGTHRTVSPAETLERIRPFFPAMGITRLANVTGLDTIGIPVVMACRPNSRSLSVSQGKGWDLDAAKVSAAMEAMEGYHAERVRLPLRLATYAELRAGERVVDVGLLGRRPGGSFHPHLPILWAEGEDWLRQETVWVPFQRVHSAYTVDMSFDLCSFEASSIGLAGGNHLAEAASHAICEVVEWEAWWHFWRLTEEDRQDRRIDLDTVDHPHCRALLGRCERAGVAVAVWDMTSPVGLAAFCCVLAERHPDPDRRLYTALGSGCHLARHIAFQRALTEAAQSRLTAISGARDDTPRWEYRRLLDPAVIERERARAAVPGSRSFARVPSREAEVFEDDLQWELELLRRAGAERVVVLDLTLPEIGIPVVRVIVPGMAEEDRGGARP
jgi:YcaO-like protein with predicted kinase domain